MKTLIGSGFVMTLLFAGACSTGGSAATGGTTGGTWGGGGTAGDGAGTGGAGTGGAAGGSGGTATGGGLGGAAWLTPATIPDALAAPAGATVKVHAHAVGSQIYTCTASAASADAGATTYAWTFKAPDAKLFDTDGVQVGTHGAGPSWTANDGSMVVGMKVAQADAPAAGSITWLLLRISSATGSGVFSDVTFVQRLNTDGGVAPATGCDSTTAGTDLPVGYTADYYFYVGGATAY